MKIIKVGFPQILPENDKSYFAILESVINTIDELSTMEIIKCPDSYTFRIAITSPSSLSPLIKSLNQLHNLLSIRVIFSKSIKSSSSISFKIKL